MPSARVFKLKGVPDDEVADVRRILKENGIPHYETPAGIWGLAGGALWVKDAGQAARARSLIDAYQHDRAEKMRQAYLRLKAEGKAETIIDRLREDPIRFVVYAAIILVVLYLSIKPFLHFAQ
jgi:hypothetical protein